MVLVVLVVWWWCVAVAMVGGGGGGGGGGALGGGGGDDVISHGSHDRVMMCRIGNLDRGQLPSGSCVRARSRARACVWRRAFSTVYLCIYICICLSLQQFLGRLSFLSSTFCPSICLYLLVSRVVCTLFPAPDPYFSPFPPSFTIHSLTRSLARLLTLPFSSLPALIPQSLSLLFRSIFSKNSANPVQFFNPSRPPPVRGPVWGLVKISAVARPSAISLGSAAPASTLISDKRRPSSAGPALVVPEVAQPIG